jgi:AcrR family transcriptional regulator
MPGQRRTRAPRHTIHRDAIAAAALDLMDTEGVRALTIRSLAARLGVAPMSLYNHVRTKEEILDAAREHGLVNLPAADPGAGTWADRVRQINLTFHRALRDHPSLVALVVARPLADQISVGAAEAQLQVLVEAGFAPDDAVRIHLTLLHYAIGAAAWKSPRVETPETGRAMIAELPAVRYPTLAALATPLAAASYDDAQYAYGLDLILSGVSAS